MHHLNIMVDGILLEQKESVKFLGIYISENMKWNAHVQYISDKVSRNVGILCKLKYYVPKNILFMLYNSLILSNISYCNIVWATAKSHIDSILLLQKKAIRICTNSGNRDHSDPLFVELKTLKVNDINFLQNSLFMFRLYNGQLPSSSFFLIISFKQGYTFLSHKAI